MPTAEVLATAEESWSTQPEFRGRLLALPGDNVTDQDRAKPIAVFFHGLNTFGDDLLHLGPVNLGKMDRHLAPALSEHGVRFIAVEKVGDGSPESQADWAISWLKQNAPEIQGKEISLLGNSIGGLVARALAKKLRDRPESLDVHVRRIITWGTPHRGTIAADLTSHLSQKFPRLYPQLTAALARVDYHVDAKSSTFKAYSPRTMESFNLIHPIHPETDEFSLLCSAPLADVSPYFWTLYPHLHGLSVGRFAKALVTDANSFAPSDGFVPIGSQTWGRERGPYRLDHFVQMGFSELLPSRNRRNFAKLEFRKLVSDLAQLLDPHGH